ncbi:12168_t:CDS:2 [Ambispora gerdemannii]|uniref:12168_t:CDS:1 n=1 Tax=Ambispora gerdemannii TaxID=144530 RepID=A0A9N9FK98_9GLOM|nr:12168_t:CDS:2 [Ambispora gerdemannii]
MDMAAFSALNKSTKKDIPDSNWDLKLHLGVTFLRNCLKLGKNLTIEKHQKVLSRAHLPSPPSVSVRKATIPETCRSQAEDILAGLLSGQEEKVGWRWREDPMKQRPLRGEWVESKKRKKRTAVDRVVLFIHGGAFFYGSAAQHRFLIQKVTKYGGARALSIDYRLAPQSPFPGALVDVLAAYFYLIHPPADAGFEPISPENIIVMGDSAGGGLTIALNMVLRDAGLPKPVAGVCWSPWVDLFHSLPSCVMNIETDYIPNGFVHKASPANPIKDYKDINQRLQRIHYYAYNSAIDIPYVSPILADDLGGLGNLFITCGKGERLHDEAILFAHKAAKTHPEVFDTKKEGRHPYPPTKVHLFVYDAMPHVFQMFLFHPAAISSIKQSAAFIRKLIPEPPTDSTTRSQHQSTVESCSDSSGSDISLLEEETENLEDENEILVQRYCDIKGKPREKNELDDTDPSVLKEWVKFLGKFPDFKAHPEYLDV